MLVPPTLQQNNKTSRKQKVNGRFGCAVGYTVSHGHVLASLLDKEGTLFISVDHVPQEVRLPMNRSNASQEYNVYRTDWKAFDPKPFQVTLKRATVNPEKDSEKLKILATQIKECRGMVQVVYQRLEDASEQ